MAGYINGRAAGAGGSIDTNEVSFINTSSVTITHSLDYNPMIWIVLSTGILIDAAITYGSGSFTISLSTPLSGTIYYR